MAQRPRPFWLIAVLLAAIFVVAGVGGGLLYLANHAGPSPGPKTIGLGDNVTVNYIGRFGSGPQFGRVFDTSIYSVAINDGSFPKSLEFALRGNATTYTPLGVHIGPTAPSSGYSGHNTSFGQVVTGFWRGLVGASGNHTIFVTIPPDEGYGASNKSCYATAPINYQVPLLVVLPTASFATAYPNVTKTVGAEFEDPTYHWEDLIYSSNSSSVTVENLPTIGFVSKPNGWPVTVANISGGKIWLTNDLTSANVGLVLGHSATKTCSTTKFIVTAVDHATGLYTEDFNSETVGQTLIFEITVVDIYR